MSKKIVSIQVLLMILFFVFVAGFTSGVFADNYPERPVTLIVPFSAGGGSDRLCRTLAPYLSEELGQRIVVENRDGAGSQIGLTMMLGASPEGYTFSQANQPHTSFTIFLQEAPYDLDDFAWLNFHHIDPINIIVMNDVAEKYGWNDFNDVVDYIRENPGEIAFGATETSGPRIFLEFIREKLDLDFIFVPYPGGGDGRAALVGNHIDVYAANVFANYPLREQAVGLLTAWDERSELWPEAPTWYELYPDDVDLAEELTEFAKPMASFRGLVINNEFKERYPQRWDRLIEAYYNAYHSEGHMKASDEIGQLPIMFWIGPEEAEKLARSAHEIVGQWTHLFD